MKYVAVVLLLMMSFVMCDSVYTIGDSNIFNHTMWNTVLHRHVLTDRTIDGVELHTINYAAIRRDKDFRNYISLLSKWHMSTVSTVEDEIALYINTYNAYAVNIVANNPCKIRFGKCK
jgi:hypothetical protein